MRAYQSERRPGRLVAIYPLGAAHKLGGLGMLRTMMRVEAVRKTCTPTATYTLIFLRNLC